MRTAARVRAGSNPTPPGRAQVARFGRVGLVPREVLPGVARRPLATLDAITAVRGFPAYLRFDNGPEFIAAAVADWCRFNEVNTIFIDPGSPWQNAWIESFNSCLRDELLNAWQFDSLLEAQVIIEDWRIEHNMHRPHSAHRDLTPSEFAQAWITRNQPALP